MQWTRGRRSQNIEDRRGMGGPGGLGRGGGIRVGRAAGGGGIGILIIAVIMLFLGVDPSILLSGGGGQLVPVDEPQQSRPIGSAQEEELKEFVSVVLADTEDTWSPIFRQLGQSYQEPTLVLFTDQVQSACGFASAATGPFYCPADRKVYLDLGFFDELDRRFGAPGDFAQAYVVAHEVGHHVQNLLGILPQVHQYRQRADEISANRASVMLELQADCFAGVWAHHADQARQLLDEGDVEEGLNAAAQIGDDRMQRRAGGWVSPESFTHGSSEQRARWFKTGMQTGRLDACDTFNAPRL
jgi:predicted metalloprotease